MIEDSLDSPYIHSAHAENFAAMVLENSHAGPVLVNFWSEKAGPCLRQYPILDKLIYQYGGRLLLVNVDADSEVKISKEYGITSVPTLKLFRHSRIIESLHGYQSETDLQKMLEQHVSQKSDQTLARAIDQYAQGEHSHAYEMIAEAIVEDPVNPRLPLALCKLLKHEARYQEAITLLSNLPPNIAKNTNIIELKNQLEFYLIAETINEPETLAQRVNESVNDLELKKQLSSYYAVQQNYAEALATLAEIIEIERNFDDEFARKAMLKIFTLLAAEDELIGQYRPLLRNYKH